MFKTIRNDFREFTNTVKEIYFAWKHSIKLKLAIKLADMKQRAMNKQYFVILSQSDKLISINNKEIERLKRIPRYNKKQLNHITGVLLAEEENLRQKMKADGVDMLMITRKMHEVKQIREKTLINLKRMRLLPKSLDSMKLRETAFYITPLKLNNDPGMTFEERYEAKVRYFAYARKYLK